MPFWSACCDVSWTNPPPETAATGATIACIATTLIVTKRKKKKKKKKKEKNHNNNNNEEEEEEKEDAAIAIYNNDKNYCDSLIRPSLRRARMHAWARGSSLWLAGWLPACPALRARELKRGKRDGANPNKERERSNCSRA
jgi:hypothetical protein